MSAHETRRNWMIALDVLGLVASVAGILALGFLKAYRPEAITEGVFGVLVTQLANLAAYFGLGLRDAHQFEFGSSRGSQIKDEERRAAAAAQASQ